MNSFGEVLENVDLKDYTTIKIGGKCKYLVKPKSTDDLINLIKYLKNESIKFYILGNGSNVILEDSYFDGVIIKLDYLNKITINDNLVTADCGVMLPYLSRIMMEQGLVSLAFASMIPGCVGSSVAGNAGCYQKELGTFVKSVDALDENYNLVTLEKKDLEFSYRDSNLKNKYIILNVTFESNEGDSILEYANIAKANEQRRNTQPLDKLSVGSIFKNPEGNSAGRLIDECGLKGYQIGGAKISEKHANFIINEQNATFNDIIDLIKLVQDKVYEKFDIHLEPEPVIVKWEEI